jgi:chromosome segregation ATPase
LDRIAAEKNDLQKSFDLRIAAREQELNKELADAIAAEKKRLQETGLNVEEVARRLKEFEAQKNAEFSSRLDAYRKQVQAEIDQRSQAVTALQAQLQSTVNEQEKLRKDIEQQTKAREQDLQSQLSSQAADLDQLKKERDELNLFFQQADNAVAAVRTSFDASDWPKTQAALAALRQILAKASASASEVIRTRALTESSMAGALDTAVAALSDSSSKTETNAQIEALKAQAKKEQALAALQLNEMQQTLSATDAKWRQAQAQADALKQNVDDLVAKLDESGTQTFNAEVQTQSLAAQVSELQKTVGDLTVWKTRAETLKTLFAASYPTAKDRFVSTFGSEAGLSLFPDFDTAWQDLERQAQEEGTSGASRKRAFDDVLTFTTYLKGDSAAAQSAHDSAEKLARTDDDYKKVVDSIQALVKSGAGESAVNTSSLRLYGAVAAVMGTKVILEPLTKIQPHQGQTMELHRVQGQQETVLGRGQVLTASNLKVELDWKGQDPAPLSGDSAYLVLP